MRPLSFLLMLITVASCQQGKQDNVLLYPVSSHHSGITFENSLTETEEMNMIEYLYFNNGGGVAAGDINNDGLVDLYFSANQKENRLYLNKGNLKFEDITRSAGVSGTGNWTTGVSMADVNGDGLLDIYVCHVGSYKSLEGKNQLFINKGDLTFADSAAAYGVDFEGFSTQAAFLDYDRDGDLDMYLLNHSVHTSRSYGNSDLRHEDDPRAGDRLYRNELNNGHHTFTDATVASGIYSSRIGYGLGVAVSDLNGDGWPDIYVSNDFHENDYLYINRHNGTFSEEFNRRIAHTSRSSMGNSTGDINNDGWPDIVVLDMLPDDERLRFSSGGEDDYQLFRMKLDAGYGYQFVRNMLQLNLGDASFAEIGRLAGIYATDWSWAPLISDLDNDGWQDLYITNGIFRRANDLEYIRYLTGGNRQGATIRDNTVPDRELYERMPLHPRPNFIFRNRGNLTFSDVSGQWANPVKTYSNGGVYADLDNDGDLDLLVNNINAPATLLENRSAGMTNHHWLELTLETPGYNKFAVGAKVLIYAGHQVLMRENFTTTGFQSSVSPVVHVGLGMHSRVDSLVILWPDGTQETNSDPGVDTLLHFVQGNTTVTQTGVKNTTQAGGRAMFKQIWPPGLAFRHRENRFNDLDRQPLIPHSLGAEGPPLAVADVNGDGLDDLYIGGASGQESALFLQQPGGSFRKVEVPLFYRERAAEETGAAFLDADGDGDQDLYLMRGGNEFPAGDPLLTDRLLMNDGSGTMKPAPPGAIPYLPVNGGCVRPADFDGDGHTDLFLGTRSIPGAYGLSPESYLLRNRGDGTFENVTAQYLKGLKSPGMVTDAAWSDVDHDGDPDLFVAGEWMGIRLYTNEDSLFTERSAAAGFGHSEGFWYSLQPADIDGDGDTDLIAGNLGWNSRLQPGISEYPELLVNDFDNNGTMDPVLVLNRKGTLFPFFSPEEMAQQIPATLNRFRHYSDYAGKTIGEILGEESVKLAVRKRAVMSSTVIWINQGGGTFVADTMPVWLQFSPVRDVVVYDLDDDDRPDLIVAGNDYPVHPSLGRYDASPGWVVLNHGGPWKTLLPRQSGLFLNEDLRTLALIRIDGKSALACAVNNDSLVVYSIIK